MHKHFFHAFWALKKILNAQDESKHFMVRTVAIGWSWVHFTNTSLSCMLSHFSIPFQQLFPFWFARHFNCVMCWFLVPSSRFFVASSVLFSTPVLSPKMKGNISEIVYSHIIRSAFIEYSLLNLSSDLSTFILLPHENRFQLQLKIYHTHTCYPDSYFGKF